MNATEKDTLTDIFLVVAIALFGDPTHVAKASYNKGTSVRNGVS